MSTSSVFSGKWALVTGASAGIGAEIARQLAARGAKLILTARRSERLEQLAAELNASGTETKIVIADLNDRDARQSIYDATVGAGIAVDVLVNNAGLGQYGSFYENPVEQELSMVRVNCEAVVHLTHLFLPHMVERQRGWVLVVASTASFQPVPYITTYAATKVFDRYFAQGLAAEVARFGIKVTALCPGPTESEFYEMAGALRFKENVQGTVQVARAGVDALERGRVTILPNRRRSWQSFVVRFLPVSFVTHFIERAARPKK
jgi:hypothetical protein